MDPSHYAAFPVKPKPLNCYSGFLPTRQYLGTPGRWEHAMHVRLTARDLQPGGGGVGHADVAIKVDPHAGPFLVSSFGKKGISVHGGQRSTIRSKVNGTHHLARFVKIVLSTDNGRHWKQVLATRRANDGRARVRFPKHRTAHARIAVQAVGNYFFGVNDHAFRIR